MCSKYNIIRFVLDRAYEDHQNLCNNNDWAEWFKSVSRMFNHKIPDGLIAALSKKNDQLRDLCVAYKDNKQMQKPIKQQEDTKYEDWKRRRDEGNRKELQRRKEEKERLAETLKAHQQRQMESHWESMQPIWNKQYNEIINKRCFEVSFLGTEVPSRH